ncbi:MAG: hypothetical protein ABGZ17_07315 [Planctomycetaceae bacterium]
MWIIEEPLPAALLLVTAAILCLGLWYSSRKRVLALLAVGLLVLCPVVFVVDQIVVTDRERIVSSIFELADAFRDQNLQKTLGHFSHNAATERARMKWAVENVRVDPDLRLTDFRTKLFAEGTRATSHFRANGTFRVMGFSGRHPSRWLLTWQQEAGRWQIIQVERLHVITGKKIGMLNGN